ncbi:GGDEF domain-containing protein [Mycobacterium haemophilum]|uniref:GGDEF domain-containing protein n=1 Tax=Mycobacterium haemophilum TaxID=29311 RepID=UPI00069A4836|nr:GGDEF domain-containing protein [Mycobacterium haemophilum]
MTNQAALFQSIVASLAEGVVVIGCDGRIELANPAAQHILDITATGHRCDGAERLSRLATYDADGRPNDPNHGTAFEAFIHAPHTGYIVGIDRPSDGQRIWLLVNSRPLNPQESNDSAVLVSFTDITDQRTASQRLAHQAAHDPLTGLPNRRYIEARLDEHLSLEYPDVLGAVLFIDLDKFKTINDSLGHNAGDIVLQTVAQRLKTALRPSDIVGRLGGDEFAALILGHVTQPQLENISTRLHAALAEPVCVDDFTFTIRASIGMVKTQHNEQRNGAQMLRDADAAMYAAKRQNGGATCYFTGPAVQLTPSTNPPWRASGFPDCGPNTVRSGKDKWNCQENTQNTSPEFRDKVAKFGVESNRSIAEVSREYVAERNDCRRLGEETRLRTFFGDFSAVVR